VVEVAEAATAVEKVAQGASVAGKAAKLIEGDRAAQAMSDAAKAANAEKVAAEKAAAEVATAEKPPRPTDGVKVKSIFSTEQLDKKFKHAPDFGVNTTKKNPQTLAQYKDALQSHLDDVETFEHGTYLHSPGSSVYFNPTTNNVLITDAGGNFLSGWKLTPGTMQFENYIKNGTLF